jgi:hypothetical protein
MVENERSWVERWNPAVKKIWLYCLAGLTWAGVGLMLCRLAYGWLRPLQLGSALLLASSGIVLALGTRLMFTWFAGKNLARLNVLNERVCVFAFQEWKSYPLVVFMISLGIFLRTSLFPKPFLAVMYIGIGGGLFLASLRYFRTVFEQGQLAG